MSFLRRLFRHERPARPPAQAYVMVLLADDASFTGAAVFDHLSTHASDLPSILGRDAQDAGTVATIPGGSLGLLHVSMPVKGEDLTGPVAVAWHWPEAAEAIRMHRTHVLVHASSSTLDAIDIRLLVTKLAASTLAVTRGVGVYVGDGMLVRSAADFLGDAANASRDNLPLLSWIGFNLVSEPGSLSGYTNGLSAFGLPELEVRNSKLAPADLCGTLADIASYELSSGQVLRDGDTFGATAAERTRVRYRPSAFIPGVTVATLELP